MKSPLISVIVPVYNASSTLHKCVDSILAQTYLNFELILVNDGSSDGSYEICEYYQTLDSRVRFINKHNGGPSSARNMGLDFATGMWVTFCDSDDYVNTEWLETFISNVSDVQLVVQGITPIGGRFNNEGMCQFEGKVRDGITILYNYPIPGSLCNKCLNRNLIEQYKLRFNEDFRFREDEDLLLRYMLHINDVRCVTYSGYNYVIPEFGVKYENVDAYPAFMSIYNSLTNVFGHMNNTIIDEYIKDLAFSVFYSYDNCHDDRRNRLTDFCKAIGSLICNVKSIPWHMRFMLGRLPSRFVHYLIEIKRNHSNLL